MSTRTSLAQLERGTAVWALQHHGVATLAQLLELGWSTDQVYHRVQLQRWRRLHRGIYQLGAGPLTRKGTWLAAVESMGDDSFLSGEAGADLRGYLKYPARRIDVVTTGDPAHALEGVHAHRTRWLLGKDRVRIDSIRVASLERLVVDFAEWSDPYELIGVLYQMQRRKKLNQRRLAAISRRLRNRRHGAASLRFAQDQLRRGSTGIRSRCELRLVQAIREAGLPLPLVNVLMRAARGRMLLDLWWPDFGVALEVDDPGHDADVSMLRDETRDDILTELGIPFERVTNGEVTFEIDVCLQRVRALLRAGGWDDSSG